MKSKLKWIKKLPWILLLPSLSAWADSSSFDVNSWVTLFEQNIGYATQIVGGFSVVAGTVFLISGVDGFHKFGKQRTMMSTNMSLISPLVRFICGAILLTCTTWINTSLFTIFGNASPEANIFSGSDDPLSVLYEPALMIVRLIGVGVFIKSIHGFYTCGSTSPRPGTVGKSLIYFFGSILCIHIQTTTQLVISFFGFSANPF